MKKSKKNIYGFTLTEIIVVILVMALILLVAIPSIVNYTQSSKSKIGKATERSLELAAKDYFSDHKAELPRLGEYSLVLGIALRNNNYLTENICDNSYVVVENKDGEYIYHVCMDCDDYKSNDKICDFNVTKPNEECKNGDCKPSCTITMMGDTLGKWTNKEVDFAIKGSVNKITRYPILFARGYINEILDLNNGSKIIKQSEDSNKNVYYKYTLKTSGIYTYAKDEMKKATIGARVADFRQTYSNLCTATTVMPDADYICTGDDCGKCVVDGHTDPSCNEVCIGENCNNNNCKPEDNCEVTESKPVEDCTKDNSCTPGECGKGQICVDLDKPTCSIRKEGNKLFVKSSDETSGISSIPPITIPSIGYIKEGGYYLIRRAGNYTFTVIDKAGNRGSCKISVKGNSITFNPNGGTGGPGSTSSIDGVCATIPNTNPTRSGYTFLGWSRIQNSRKVDYKSGDCVELNGDLTLYAVWRREIEVTFAPGKAKWMDSQTRSCYLYNNETSCKVTSPDITFLDQKNTAGEHGGKEQDYNSFFNVLGWGADPVPGDKTKTVVRVKNNLTVSQNRTLYPIISLKHLYMFSYTNGADGLYVRRNYNEKYYKGMMDDGNSVFEVKNKWAWEYDPNVTGRTESENNTKLYIMVNGSQTYGECTTGANGKGTDCKNGWIPIRYVEHYATNQEACNRTANKCK